MGRPAMVEVVGTDKVRARDVHTTLRDDTILLLEPGPRDADESARAADDPAVRTEVPVAEFHTGGGFPGDTLPPARR
ncbi:MAG: hypothetical protein QM638_04790 [Nocardioides sp.]|uniref:hypothetical protein n=1 Tax=Nocardioides sp. TaxID=35761 RepID=UPI0039E5CFDA